MTNTTITTTQEELANIFENNQKYFLDENFRNSYEIMLFIKAFFKRRVIDIAEDELKEAFETGQCDLWFESMKEGRGKETKYTFKIHTRNESEKPEENAKLMVQKTKAVYRIMLANFKNDPKFSKKVFDWVSFHIEHVDEMLSKLERIEKNRAFDKEGKDEAELTQAITAFKKTFA